MDIHTISSYQYQVTYQHWIKIVSPQNTNLFFSRQDIIFNYIFLQLLKWDSTIKDFQYLLSTTFVHRFSLKWFQVSWLLIYFLWRNSWQIYLVMIADNVLNCNTQPVFTINCKKNRLRHTHYSVLIKVLTICLLNLLNQCCLLSFLISCG